MSIYLLSILGFAMSFGQEPPKMPTGEEALQLALKQRQAITKVAATFRSRMEKPGQKEPWQGKSRPEWSVRFWLDGNKLRNDELTAPHSFQCLNCPKDGQFIFFMNIKPDPAHPVVAVELRKITNAGTLNLTDPRVLGLQTVDRGLLWSYKMDSLIGRADRTKATLEKGKWQGHDCYIVRSELSTAPKSKIAWTIVPGMDHSVVRIEAENKTKENKGWSGKCESVMLRYGKPGIWFPKSCVIESSVEGKVEWRDMIEVTDVTLNEALPATAFSLAGMDIPVGALMKDTEAPNKLYKWDGKNPVEVETGPRNRPTDSSPPEESQSGKMPRTGLFAASGSLAVFGAVALGLFYRKRKPSTKELL